MVFRNSRSRKKCSNSFNFFQSRENGDVKVNKPQRIFAKTDSELGSLSDFLHKGRHNKVQKETLEVAVELSKIEEKDKIMGNSHAMFQIKEVLNFQHLLLLLAN